MIQSGESTGCDSVSIEIWIKCKGRSVGSQPVWVCNAVINNRVSVEAILHVGQVEAEKFSYYVLQTECLNVLMAH